ncbi:uncharacterized protein LOC134196708 [Corticium candelabrum]|uniref:uncharacterized protein LOC134196708 n=1 Tax=Corticium candelabrum TaxID=121492 RepID=UPI002E2562A1|nr:uncharacterized protein LOC134196708 [Corticium candelabrum]
MRSLLQFQLFEKRMLRLFTVPMETEQYTRVIATTNASVMLRELEKDPQGVCGRLLAHQLMACPGGDWVGTMVAFQHSNVASDRPIGSDTGVPVGLTDRISVIESVTSECTDVKSKHLARQYSQDISGCPLPVAVRQSYASAGSQPSATHLFPHQLNTLQWMLDVEEGRSEVLRVPQAAVFHGWFAYSHGMEKDMLPGDIEILESSSLALGGLVAHPVGSGKTVIAIELVKVTASSGMTVICVPGHIADQWRQEIARFAPTLSCIVVNNKSSLANLRGVAAVIIPYDVFQSPLLLDTFCLMRWRRVIFDEPQDIVKKEYFDQLAFGLHCPYRWLLSATPNPMQDMIQLALGYKPDGRLPLESIHKWFIRTRCRRDSPSMCLPVPPLHVHMLPVTLTWQETVVAHMHAMADHLQASIRLCSYFANVDIRGNISESNEARTDAAGCEPVLLGVRRFSSLDDWIVSHRQELQDELDHIQSNLHHITLLVRQQYHQFQQHLEAIPIVSDQESDVVNSDDHFDQEAMEVMFDEHSGVDPELVSRRQELIREAKKHERLLRFMESVCQTISSEMECTICMERLGLSIITMLPCLHSFCAICVINLFGDLQTASCPVCRSEAQRRELCTFRCNDQVTDDVWISTGLLSDDPESPHFRGSKLWTLAREVGRVLDKHLDDKVLIFAQWDELLRQISLILPTDNCLLVGSMDVRCRLIENFQRNPTPRVLLLSLDQQVSGANLDVANHVFVVHPYCPASVASTASVPLARAQAYEQQAVGRVLRFPQLKDVHLYRLYARGTVEEELYMHWGWA